MNKTLLVAGSLLVLSSSLLAQSTTYVDKDGRNIGYSTQHGNYTTYTDQSGNKGYSYSDGTTTNFTGKDGRPANPNEVIPSPPLNYNTPTQINPLYQPTGR